MGNREEVVEVDSFNSPVGNYVATYGALALALMALSISALVSIPGGYSNNNARFNEMPSFKLYNIASIVCFSSSTASLLILFLLKFNTHDGAKEFLKFVSICCIHVSVVSLVVVATAIEFLIDGSYSLLKGIGPALGILSGIIVYHLWNWLVKMAGGLKNATVWVFHMLKNATFWVLNAVRAQASYQRLG
uniref:PGG domain-containing protein n=2 Tax=Cannabis sativa TaxID=3483 RepID=A0A803PLX7_CANSA